METQNTDTRSRIIKSSFRLFSKHGYNNVPVSLILKKTGISKGGLYHHFKSKEEILDVIARKQVNAVFHIIKKIAGDNSLSAVEKFNQLMEQVQSFRETNKEQSFKLFEPYLNDKNRELRHKLELYTLKKVHPLYVSIVEQGVDEGSFFTGAPDIAVEVIIRMAPIMRMKMILLYQRRDKVEQYEQQIERIADYLEEFVTKVLGAKEGALNIASHFKVYFLNNRSS